MVTNWAKIIGTISAGLGIAVVVFPIPDVYKVYILGTETLINGLLQFWYGTPAGSQPVPATSKA